MKEMIEEWRQELIEAGEIKPSDKLSDLEIQMKYQEFQIKKMKSTMSDLGKSLGITLPKEEEPKKKKVSEPKPTEKPLLKDEKKIIGGTRRNQFSQLLKEFQDLQKSLDVKFTENQELFNAFCSSTCPELLEVINDESKSNTEKKMSGIREVMKKIVNKSKNGFPIPKKLEDKFSDYLEDQNESNAELKSIYSQMEEKSLLMLASIINEEEV
ncbi:MAG: hypothetical protein FK734_03395 [Asgard group archaeon]|nr:hypothetical protein [Asgard group archaeon]